MADLSDRKPNDFTPVMASMELADYVLHITDNPKNFPICKTLVTEGAEGMVVNEINIQEDYLIDKIREQAYKIYMNVSRSNRINFFATNLTAKVKDCVYSLRLFLCVKTICVLYSFAGNTFTFLPNVLRIGEV